MIYVWPLWLIFKEKNDCFGGDCPDSASLLVSFSSSLETKAREYQGMFGPEKPGRLSPHCISRLFQENVCCDETLHLPTCSRNIGNTCLRSLNPSYNQSHWSYCSMLSFLQCLRIHNADPAIPSVTGDGDCQGGGGRKCLFDGRFDVLIQICFLSTDACGMTSCLKGWPLCFCIGGRSVFFLPLISNPVKAEIEMNACPFLPSQASSAN